MNHQPPFRPDEALRTRLRAAASPLMDDHGGAPLSCLSDLEAIHWLDRAWLVMLHAGGVIPDQRIGRYLRVIADFDPANPPAEASGAGSAWYSGETLLIRTLGLDVGGDIHVGRSTHDIFGVVWRLRLRECVLGIADSLSGLRATLLSLASEHRATHMPYFTHRVEAQNTTLGHMFHAFASAAERDHRRLSSAYRTVDVCPAGAAAGVATLFAVDRPLLADLLGFQDVSGNTRDAIHHDGVWEVAAAINIVSANLAHLAEDVFQWLRLGFLDIGDEWCRSSSLMPGKRSVTALEEFAQLHRTRVSGRAIDSYPVWYWAELLPHLNRTNWVLRALTGILASAHIDRQRMREATREHWGQLTDLAALLVLDGLATWRAAHLVLARVARIAEDEGIAPVDLDVALVERCARALLGRELGITDEHIARAFDVERCTRERSSLGSPGTDELIRQIDAARSALAADQREIATARNRIDSAQAALDARIASMRERYPVEEST